MISFRPIDDDSLVDALTGATLRDGAIKCACCDVRYNRESASELMTSNSGKCVSCDRPFAPAT